AQNFSRLVSDNRQHLASDYIPAQQQREVAAHGGESGQLGEFVQRAVSQRDERKLSQKHRLLDPEGLLQLRMQGADQADFNAVAEKPGALPRVQRGVFGANKLDGTAQPRQIDNGFQIALDIEEVGLLTAARPGFRLATPGQQQCQ